MKKGVLLGSLLALSSCLMLAAGGLSETKAQANLGAQTNLADQIAKADIGYGEYLAGECVTCHRKSGSGIPQINGIEAETFVTIMQAYRSKDLDNKVMQMMAGRLDDEQIISLAAYFSSLPE